MNETAWILVAGITGLILGWVLCYGVIAVRRAFNVQRARADAAYEETQVAQARSETAAARAEASQARAELARAETSIERAHSEVADAHAQTAEFQALLAAEEATVSKVSVERDSALEQAEQLRIDHETMLNAYKALSSEALDKQTKTVEAQADQRLQATEQLMGALRASLEQLQTRLTDIEKERVSISTEMISQVRSVQFTGEQLRKETSALVTALRRPNVRGAWGELQLKRAVELAGMVDHCDFVMQESSTTDDSVIRPDMKVNLAGGRFIYVDAKTPLEGFLNAEMADSDHERAKHLGLFAKNVRDHITALSSKTYWKADWGTPEFVILFLPSEALLQIALEQSSDLIEYAVKRNIMLATPTTLITMLRAVAYAWTQEVLAESAREVSQLGRELYERLSKMGSHFDQLARALDTSVNAYNNAIGSLESRVLVSARRFRDLRLSEDELGELVPVTIGTRPLAAPELIASAVEVSPMIGRTRSLTTPEASERVEDDRVAIWP